MVGNKQITFKSKSLQGGPPPIISYKYGQLHSFRGENNPSETHVFSVFIGVLWYYNFTPCITSGWKPPPCRCSRGTVDGSEIPCDHQSRSRLVAKKNHYLHTGFYINPRWLGMGFLNHQQHDWKKIGLEGDMDIYPSQ